MDQGGDHAPRHLVSHHVLQFHSHHVRHRDASARSKEFAVERCRGGQGPRWPRNRGPVRSGQRQVTQSRRPQSVGDYLERVRDLSKVTKPDDAVFTIINGKPAKYLHSDTVQALLEEAGLREGPNGTPRSTYCFRHTYATFRLSDGVDVYILADQMGTSVKMIEVHYGHVNTIKHADRVLMGMTGWELIREPGDDSVAAAKAAKAAATRGRASRAGPMKRSRA